MSPYYRRQLHFRKGAKGAKEVKYQIKFAVFTSIHLIQDVLRQWEPILAPDSGILTRVVPLITRLKIVIPSLCLPYVVVFLEIEWCAGIHEPIKGDEITHGSHGIVK